MMQAHTATNPLINQIKVLLKLYFCLMKHFHCRNSHNTNWRFIFGAFLDVNKRADDDTPPTKVACCTNIGVLGNT